MTAGIMIVIPLWLLEVFGHDWPARSRGYRHRLAINYWGRLALG
jgi:hypothetical protein